MKLMDSKAMKIAKLEDGQDLPFEKRCSKHRSGARSKKGSGFEKHDLGAGSFHRAKHCHTLALEGLFPLLTAPNLAKVPALSVMCLLVMCSAIHPGKVAR